MLCKIWPDFFSTEKFLNYFVGLMIWNTNYVKTNKPTMKSFELWALNSSSSQVELSGIMEINFSMILFSYSFICFAFRPQMGVSSSYELICLNTTIYYI